MKRLSFALITVVAVFTGCKSYEDSFNRNLNSTGLYVANSASNTISMFAADPKSGKLRMGRCGQHEGGAGRNAGSDRFHGVNGLAHIGF